MLFTFNVQFAYLYPRKARATPLAHRGEVGDFCRLRVAVVRKVDNAIHRINHYPVDSVVCFVYTYPLDSDLSGG